MTMVSRCVTENRWSLGRKKNKNKNKTHIIPSLLYCSILNKNFVRFTHFTMLNIFTEKWSRQIKRNKIAYKICSFWHKIYSELKISHYRKNSTGNLTANHVPKILRDPFQNKSVSNWRTFYDSIFDRRRRQLQSSFSSDAKTVNTNPV